MTTEFFTHSEQFYVANYFGVYVWTVSKIGKEGTEAGESSLSIPGKKLLKGEEYKCDCDITREFW